MRIDQQLQLAMILWALGALGAAGGVVAHTETWNATAAGWVDRDAGEMVVAHSGAVGHPAGSLGGQFAAQEIPAPETDAFRATSASSGGDFTGNYWAVESAYPGWGFDFYAADVLPSTLQVRFGGAGFVFFANVKPQVGGTGAWYTVKSPATFGGNWFGGTEVQWSNALASVEFVEVQVARNGAGAQAYYMDNFSNNAVVAHTASIGDRAWYDANSDGLQDAGETVAILNLPVALLDASSNLVVATTTDASGRYRFSSLTAGTYVVRFDLAAQASLSLSPANAGGDPARDSDATSGNTGGYAWTAPFSISVGETNLNIDVGLMPKDTTRAVMAEVWGEWTGGAGRVAWRTSSEWGTAGFYVYRVEAETGAETRLSDMLLPSTFQEAGAVYMQADPEAREDGAGTYRLEEVELSGRVHDLGTHEIRFAAPRPMALAARARVRAVQAAAPVQTVASQIPGPSRVLKVFVKEEGIYGVGLQAIADGMGVALEAVRTLAATGALEIAGQGQPVPMLYDAVRSRLVFHGAPPPPNGYTRDAAYLISAGAGRFMPRRAPGAAAGAATVFPVQIHFEQDRYLGNPALPTMPANFYYWNSVVSTTSANGGLRSFPLDLAGRSGSDLVLKVLLMGWSSTTNNPDHRAEFRFNGAGVGAITFDGQETAVATLTIPGAVVSNGVNTLAVKGVLQAGRSYSLFAVDWIDAAFDRKLAPLAGTAHFRAGAAAAVSATNFTNPLALALDEAGNPTWIADGNGALPAKAWTVAATNERFAVIEAAAVPMLVPEAAAADAWFLAATNRIDYLVIVSRALAPAAQELADYRASQGLRVGVAVFEDVCDLLAGGLRTPAAIPALLRQAKSTWAEAPWMVVLAGNGHYDYLGVEGTEACPLPPMMYQTQDGICAVDGLLADLDGDQLPDFALGRLPALTAEDLAAMIAKIKLYEAGFGSAWQNQLVLAADAGDSGNDFATANTRLAALVAAPYSVERRIDLDTLEITQAADQFRGCFQSGAGFLHYTGHGGVNNLSAQNLLTGADVATLENSTRPPITVALSCLVGRYEDPSADSLGELLMRRAGGGAVAVLGPSGLSRNDSAGELGEAFYRAILQEGAGTLGLAFLQARRSLPDTPFTQDTFAIYNLLGDPALRIAGNTGGQASDASFAQWRWQRFSPGALANPEASGASPLNFFDYALGGGGGLKLGRPHPSDLGTGSGFILEWQRRMNRSDVDYRLCLSENLRDWETQSADDLPTAGVVPDLDGIMETVRTQVIRTNTAHLFLGIKAVRK